MGDIASEELVEMADTKPYVPSLFETSATGVWTDGDEAEYDGCPGDLSSVRLRFLLPR